MPQIGPLNVQIIEIQNVEIQPPKLLNIIAGDNGSGKTVLLNEFHKILNGKKSESITDAAFHKSLENLKVYYIKQDDLIFNKQKIHKINQQF